MLMVGALSKAMIPIMVPSSSFLEQPPSLTAFLTDKAAEILATLCMRVSSSPDRALPGADNPYEEGTTWMLKANVTVYRHADRTPKQKLKL